MRRSIASTAGLVLAAIATISVGAAPADTSGRRSEPMAVRTRRRPSRKRGTPIRGPIPERRGAHSRPLRGGRSRQRSVRAVEAGRKVAAQMAAQQKPARALHEQERRLEGGGSNCKYTGS